MSVAVVQGASRGLGLALAKTLLSRTQLSVVATCRQPESSEAAMLRYIGDQTLSKRLTILPLDVTDEATIRAAAKQVQYTYGDKPVKLFLNVAGILHAEKAIEQMDMHAALETFQINTLGPMASAKHFVPLLCQDANPEDPFLGEFSVFASISARVGSIGDNRLGGWYSYRCSKAAVNQFTRTLSREFNNRKRKSLAVSLHPGTVDTGLSAPFQANIAKSSLFTPDVAANHLFQVLQQLSARHNGRFLAWDGKEIEY
ncbi:cell-cell signaling protein csgA-like protein [Basidiobolus meristosporus CBS 931.73]|uniref:Cell-cell signaling protein csgA-like protein n=1 Tax=Basidiobolus meristosporus CBS 931.73 TaxID=1314790 RepID=A0A1Y1Y3I7_9FUNG|nr:cell-cell signaling protein csgA-like protein [Basidiobolus meristosporus CBS 931.73]|eukprot:ORX92445.1 cell-cell signaling protein csgA-like protein [Basidiobolus meristosporus CBS 931.73]